MALSGGLHPLGVVLLLAGAFLPIMDFFITNVALSSIVTALHNATRGRTVVLATHSAAVARSAGVRLQLADGTVHSARKVTTVCNALAAAGLALSLDSSTDPPVVPSRPL